MLQDRKWKKSGEEITDRDGEKAEDKESGKKRKQKGVSR